MSRIEDGIKKVEIAKRDTGSRYNSIITIWNAYEVDLG